MRVKKEKEGSKLIEGAIHIMEIKKNPRRNKQ